MSFNRLFSGRWILLAICGVAIVLALGARTIKIVALGDTNFGAPGVSRSQTYPAQL